MENKSYTSLRSKITKFPLLSQILDDAFIKEQCNGVLKNFLLLRSDNGEALRYLESCLQLLSEVEGYDLLKARLKGVCGWDGYQEILAQINATVWFKQRDILEEIEPKLPQKRESCDCRLSFDGQQIYCEIWSAQSYMRSFETKKKSQAADLHKKEPWMSLEEAKHEVRNRAIVRTLKSKTNRQLPPNQHGILWIDGARGWLRHFDAKIIAERLFPLRPQVASIMLWSLEAGSQIGEAPFCFVNSNSDYQDISLELLRHLGRINQIF